MMDLKIQLEDDQVKATLERLRVATGGNLGEAMREIGRTLKTSTQLRFRDQTDPDGMPWIPSKRVKEHGGQTLRLSGRLRNSITYRAGETSVAVGTNVIYARAHQFGRQGSEQVKPHSRRVTVVFGRHLTAPVTAQVKGFTRRVLLPTRAFIGASIQDRADIMAILSRQLFKAAGVHAE